MKLKALLLAAISVAALAGPPPLPPTSVTLVWEYPSQVAPTLLVTDQSTGQQVTVTNDVVNFRVKRTVDLTNWISVAVTTNLTATVPYVDLPSVFIVEAFNKTSTSYWSNMVMTGPVPTNAFLKIPTKFNP